MNYQANNILDKKGWAEIKLSNESILKLDNLIKYSETILSDKKINFLDKNNFHNEVIKSTIRSLLRYSNESKIFVKYLIKDLVKYKKRINDFYLTPPYIIIHQPKDHLEVGTFHSDTVKHCGNSFTSWTPINNYKMSYPALSIIDKSHSFCVQKIFKILKKIKLSNIDKIFKFLQIKSIDLLVKKNFTYLWHSDLIHKGNLNKSDKIHIAIVTRISEKPLYYEPTVKISKINDNENVSNEKKIVNFKNLSSKIFEICELIEKEIDLIKYSYQLKDITDKDLLKHISFALSIIAQRTQSNFSYKLDMLSFLLTNENLVSLERFLTKFKDKEISRNIIKKFYENKNLSYQEAMIINKFKNLNSNNLLQQKKLRWLE
jgi:hypothetical protein